ncbi:MAG: hypothetical protein WCC26_09450 [Terracidiphilus sp.]
MIAFALLISWATVSLPYQQIASILKRLALVLLAYPIAAFAVGANWVQVLRATGQLSSTACWRLSFLVAILIVDADKKLMDCRGCHYDRYVRR